MNLKIKLVSLELDKAKKTIEKLHLFDIFTIADFQKFYNLDIQLKLNITNEEI